MTYSNTTEKEIESLSDDINLALNLLDWPRSAKKPDRQIGTARSAPDHFRLASGY